ncbi:MAG: hypothetical protein GOV15_04550 [Candidatus Diapherotrites archaeon]|nr:hypothetical protein [Candidatus Diapherotrites archaeon]
MQKKAILALLGGAGFLVILIGIFTPIIDFMYGVIGAFAVWIITGALKTYWGIGHGKKSDWAQLCNENNEGVTITITPHNKGKKTTVKKSKKKRR